MNPALEYILREKRADGMLEPPFSIFLTEIKTNRKKVITVTDKVQKWNLDVPTKGLPPSEVSLYDKDFSKLVLPGHQLFYFSESWHRSSAKQSNNSPQAEYQDVEYKSHLDNFYNPVVHTEARTNWLWMAFVFVHNKNFSFISMPPPEIFEVQRMMMRGHPKWSIWLQWRKYLLDFPTTIASELVFYRYYHK